ncbi:MAG: hypothetical protein ACI87E_004520 [Mariniblastus sp.]
MLLVFNVTNASRSKLRIYEPLVSWRHHDSLGSKITILLSCNEIGTALNDPDSIQREESPWRIALEKGKRAAWQNRWPGALLWMFGLTVILGYFSVPPIRNFFEYVGELKTEMGLWFGIISTSVFGGLLPVVLPMLFRKPRTTGLAGLIVSNMIFWAVKGIEVDVLYRIQDWLFGNRVDISTIAAKVFVDLVIYAPAIGLFNCVLFYIWRDNGYSFAKTRQSLGERWYVRKVLPALISNWCVWLPAVIMIYSLPLALQLPVQNLILCFWVLILVFFTADETNDHDLISEFQLDENEIKPNREASST